MGIDAFRPKIEVHEIAHVAMGPIRFCFLALKPNHLFIVKTKPNRLKFMKPFKPNRLELSRLKIGETKPFFINIDHHTYCKFV